MTWHCILLNCLWNFYVLWRQKIGCGENLLQPILNLHKIVNSPSECLVGSLEGDTAATGRSTERRSCLASEGSSGRKICPGRSARSDQEAFGAKWTLQILFFQIPFLTFSIRSSVSSTFAAKLKCKKVFLLWRRATCWGPWNTFLWLILDTAEAAFFLGTNDAA